MTGRLLLLVFPPGQERLEDRKSSTSLEEVDKPKDFSTSVSLDGYVTPWVSAKDIFIGYAKSAKKKKQLPVRDTETIKIRNVGFQSRYQATLCILMVL